MGFVSDASTLMVRAISRFTVHHGDGLGFSDELVEPAMPLAIPTRHGAVACHMSAPKGHDRSTLAPVYVHFHGGGFLIRQPHMDDFFTHHVAAQGCLTITPDYGVPPRHRYPVAHDQALDVVQWLQEHGDQVDVDGSRVAVGGFSAGANLAASVSLRLRDAGLPVPVAQVLAVPVLDVINEHKRTANPQPMVSPSLIRMVRDAYFRDQDRRTEPAASPLFATDLSGLPPTMILTADQDALREEGDEFAARLRQSRVPTMHIVIPGRDHLFMEGTTSSGRESARELMDLMAAHIAHGFDPA